MFGDVFQVEKVLAVEVEALEAGCLSGPDAERLLGSFTRIERLAVAARTRLARRIDQSNVWRRDGYKTAASYLAQQTGESLGHALGMLETAEQLEKLPATAEAFNAGKLSMTQVREITGAAAVNPAAEPRLLAAAPRQPLSGLRTEARAAKAAAADREQDQARYRRIHQTRYWRKWTDADGAICGKYRLAPDVGAAMHAEIEAAAGEIFAAARSSGRREPVEAYGADALVGLVHAGAAGGGGDGTDGPRATINVRVDKPVFDRGYAEDGEVCEIPGLGPIPAATARHLAEDAFWKILITDGVDVQAVVHAGRSIPAHLRTALQERDRECCQPECHVIHGLEIHHLTPFALGTPASLATCARVCQWHHHLISYCGYRLEGTPGHWIWISPGDPDPQPPP